MNETELEIDIQSLLEIIWNRKKTLIFLLILCIGLGIAFTLYVVKPMYRSSTTLILSKPITEDVNDTNDYITQNDILLNQKLVSTYAEIIRSYEIGSKIIQNLGLNITEADLSNRITVSSVKDTVIIQITVRDRDPQMATNIANEAAKVFSEEIERIYKIQNISIIDRAMVPSSAYNINHIRDIAVAIGIAIVLDVLIALVVMYSDTTIKSAEEIEKMFDVPVLGVIGKFTEDVSKVADKLTPVKVKKQRRKRA